jgi:hypothetical protein
MIPIAALVFFAAAAPAPATGASAFEAARKIAIANAKTAQGRKYQKVFAKAFSESQAGELGRCVESQTAPDLSPFEALTEIAANGSVEAVLVRPDSNVAVCLRKSIRKHVFPRPPRAHYWTSTTLRLSH